MVSSLVMRCCPDSFGFSVRTAQPDRERDIVACINHVFREWENENVRKEPDQLKSLANQLKIYKVPLAIEFEGHEFKTQPVPCQEPRKFKDGEQDEAMCWLSNTIF